ncbi:hypothetical protein PPYR_12413 [Photinus pyralis]|uniref:TATA box-binding protein-associated factor RNA polymerase I subunit B n=1 Tax=Photinus pyralis TaxID=7054 RepID=A0A1Y1KA02_PHOPY|nr:TATA box-binding protein-associated factor RNA polymerase I subunit B [Photinus pyralis]KAB0795574.1 hypothetical protein PPYR_12413 [Photinus pyralis]
MENEISCNVCGGISFHKDAGFYYCNECLTQSQEVREQVFDVHEDGDENSPPIKQKITKQRRSPKSVDRLTTWECYNYILRGLVEELIGLGADVNLRKTVHILWLMYLKELEVTGDLPKVGAVHSKLDAELVYGKLSKRKRKTSTRRSSPVDSFTNESLSQRTHSKDRHSYLLAQYNEISSTLPSDDLNQSLTSLRSPSAASSDSETRLQYSKLAKKELLKTMKAGHLKRHINDTNNEHTCHKGTYKNFTRSYVEGPAVLSRIKIYALLNLALLINKDNIQLGDLIRFIREGHLSFHYINHFYPEGYDNVQFNLKTWNDGKAYPSHSWMRSITAKLAHFLNVSANIPMQNLPQLCHRYCHELNLPDEVWGYCVNLLSHITPIMAFTKNCKIIPNYEGRVMSVIIFVLKLIFGLDNETERFFSKRAEEINKRDCKSVEKLMFVWDDWLFHILYRKLLLAQYHFPTQYLYDDENVENTGVFLNFINAQNSKFEEETKLNRESEVIQQLLAKLKDKQYELPTSLTFNPSLTPFRRYTEVLANCDMIDKQSCLVDVLKLNFTNTSIKFCLNPFKYLLELYPNSKIGLKHRGVQNNIQLISYKSLKTERELWRKEVKKEAFIQLTNARTTESLSGNLSNVVKLDDVVLVKDSKSILRNFEERHKNSYLKHMKRLLNICKSENVENCRLPLQSGSPVQLTTVLHYNPYESYLLHSYNVSSMSYTECRNFIKKFPISFQTLMSECARITEQDEKDLFDEFHLTEIYLSYVAKWTQADQNRERIVNKNLQNFIAEAKQIW